jgi:hypothetical protein
MTYLVLVINEIQVWGMEPKLNLVIPLKIILDPEHINKLQYLEPKVKQIWESHLE